MRKELPVNLSKPTQKLWMLRRMGKLPFRIHQMFDFYTKAIWSIVELAVPVWHPGLTIKQTYDIARIQKVAMKVSLHYNYKCLINVYDTNLATQTGKIVFDFCTQKH